MHIYKATCTFYLLIFVIIIAMTVVIVGKCVELIKYEIF